MPLGITSRIAFGENQQLDRTGLTERLNCQSRTPAIARYAGILVWGIVVVLPAGLPRRAGMMSFYGWRNIVTAALANPARHFRRLLATENAVRRLADEGIAPPLPPEVVRPDAIAALLTPDAVHNGLLAEADPCCLATTASRWCSIRIIDLPIGAIYARAFAVAAVIVITRKATGCQIGVPQR